MLPRSFTGKAFVFPYVRFSSDSQVMLFPEPASLTHCLLRLPMHEPYNSQNITVKPKLIRQRY
jgi:hypothetical protein